MAKIIIYDPTDLTVPNRVTEYNRSAHTPDYTGESNKLVNPDVSSLENGSPPVPRNYWKVSGSPLIVVEMSTAEKQALTPTSKTGVHNTLTFEKGLKFTSFRRIASFVYEGSAEHGVPYEVELIAYVDSGATGEVRLYDKTNKNIIASLTVTNTEEDKLDFDFGSPLLWPVSSAIVEVQAKRASGTGTKKLYVNGMMVGY